LGLSTGGGVAWGAATGSATGLASGLAMVRAARARRRVVLVNIMVMDLLGLMRFLWVVVGWWMRVGEKRREVVSWHIYTAGGESLIGQLGKQADYFTISRGQVSVLRYTNAESERNLGLALTGSCLAGAGLECR
jgi:hypothetical protein